MRYGDRPDDELTPEQLKRRQEYRANPSRAKESARRWAQENGERVRARAAKYRTEHREQYRRYAREWRRNNATRLNEIEKKRSQQPHRILAAREYTRKATIRLKTETMMAYGGHCVCCGETQMEFLTLDHINNDGGKRRKEGLDGVGKRFYQALKKDGFPQRSDLQVLCCNCNFAKRFSGICPHQMIANRLLGVVA